MGKGDIRTKRGKITNGTFGVSRPSSTDKKDHPTEVKTTTKKAPKKATKAPAKKAAK
jgi:ribosomal small subunit protein bTHX